MLLLLHLVFQNKSTTKKHNIQFNTFCEQKTPLVSSFGPPKSDLKYPLPQVFGGCEVMSGLGFGHLAEQ